MIYTFKEFINDCHKIVELTQDVNNFKWNICEINKPGDILINILNLKYLSSNIIIENCLIEFDIIYSEVYQMPTAYFIIQDLNHNKFLCFEEFIDKINQNYSKSEFIMKGYEITKTVYNKFKILESSLQRFN